MLKAILRPVYRPIMRAFEKSNDSRNFLLRRMPARAVCAEIGVFRGDFSQQIVQKTRPRELHLIDPWKYNPAPDYSQTWYGGDKLDQSYMDAVYDQVCRRLHTQIDARTVQLHRQPSTDAAVEFPAEYFDWIYIDGDHHYEAVRNDLTMYYAKVKRGGYVAGDDYGEGGWWNGGVKKAVDELIASGIYVPVLIKNTQFILRKP